MCCLLSHWGRWRLGGPERARETPAGRRVRAPHPCRKWPHPARLSGWGGRKVIPSVGRVSAASRFRVPVSPRLAGKLRASLDYWVAPPTHPLILIKTPGWGEGVCVCVSVCVCTHTCGPLVSWAFHGPFSARVRRARQTGPREGVSETFGLSLWVLYPDAVSPRFFFKAPVASRDVSQGGRSRDCGRPGTGCHVFLFPGSWQLPRACL